MTGRTSHRYHLFGQGYRPGRRWESCLIAPVFLLAVSSQSLAQNPPPSSEFKISTDVELVLLDVSVKDPKGGYVSGLNKESGHPI
jgi:hypothetical protein